MSKKSLDAALYSLGQALEEQGWSPEGGLPLVYEGSDKDSLRERLFRAQAFMKLIQRELQSFACTSDGNVKPQAKVFSEIVRFCTNLSESQIGISIDGDIIADVLVHMSLEAFCRSSV